MWRLLLPATSPSRIVNEGIEQFNRKNFEEAIRCFSQALEMDSRSAIAAIAWGRKGNCYVSLKQYSEAVECYDRSLEINPSASNIWYIKGFVLHLIGRSSEALPCLERAIEINPEYGAAWESKGDVLATLHKYDEALACYTTARGLNPEHDERLAEAIARCRLLLESRECVSNSPGDGRDAECPPEVRSTTRARHPSMALPPNTGDTLNEIQAYEETVRRFLAQIEETSWILFRNRLEQDSTALKDQIHDQREMIRELSAILAREEELIGKLGIILEIQSNFIDRLIQELDIPPERQSQ
ncbi:MAG: tetratricopeptide repeat protein [Methanomicrobiales archaeon]|nr:tetratricopeptide repeat protein [Methanomicrobiales archaeon]MDI6877421.1 tetratricopeptide repeat protein [Methanomicrobiales archaeon]